LPAGPPSPPAPTTFRVTLCSGPECGDQRGSAALHDSLQQLLRARGLTGQVTVAWQCCFGQCSHGPNVFVRPGSRVEPATMCAPCDVLALPAPGAALYGGVTASDLERIVEEHLQAGQIVQPLVLRRR
jgi:(2Fe-2S) ferredoxin